MGEVWRAVDTALGRDVALKLLPSDLSSDPERLARLEREAKLLAQLSHPNVAAIYGFEAWEGKRFLVLELAEGVDLAERIARGPVPVDEAVEIAKQIAAALEAAHDRGIVHRDLKPANVKLSDGGRVKVLDFGLAKAWRPDSRTDTTMDLSHSPTLAYAGTEAGVILGTAGYMSPEQARGKPVDKGADIWALGVVLWEMLTGRRLFSGETVSDVLAAVLTREPDWASLPAAAARFRGVLERCLERDPRRRMRDAGDLRVELERAEAQPAAAPPAPALDRRRGALWASSVLAALALGALAGRLVWPPPAEKASPSRTLSIELPRTQELSIADQPGLAFTPDGETLIFSGQAAGRRQLFRRPLSSPSVTPIEGTEGGNGPFVSPDGQWIGFTTRDRLSKVAAQGGRPYDLGSQQGAGGAAWLSGREIVIAPIYSDGLFRVSAEGGELKRLSTPDRKSGELGHWWPQVLPGGKAVLFTGFRTPVDASRVAVLWLETGEVRDVVQGGFHGRYLPGGYLVYAKGQRLYAATFDAGRAAVTGPARAVLDDISSSQTGGFAQYDVSAQGTLAYVPASVGDPLRELVWLDRAGKLEKVLPETRRFRDPALSPDGKQIAVTIQDENLDVWTISLERGTLSRLTSSPRSEFGPVWTAGGREVLFVVDRPPFEIHRIPFGSSAEAAPLWKESTELDTVTGAVSADGTLITYNVTEPETGTNIWVRRLDGTAPGRPFRATRAGEGNSSFSPDARYLAYASDETGRPEVYVEAYPGPGDRHQVSADGGTFPVWARNGELFYRHDDELRVVAVSTQPRFEPRSTRTLFKRSWYAGSASFRTYDVTSDGSRILTVQVPEASIPRRIDVVTDWLAELRRLMSAK